MSAASRLFAISHLLIDSELGIIKSVRQLRREAGAPDFFHYYAYACNTSAFCLQSNFRNAGGASIHRRTAVAKAIGEAVERYCSAIYEQDQFPLFAFIDAPFPCVPPEDFALYKQEQYSQHNFPYTQFNRQTPVRWAPAIDASTHEVCWLPASMVVLPYTFDEAKGEKPIGQRISTGLACHCSYSEAAISGLCEVIERDAFTIMWQRKLAMPVIRNNSLSPANSELVKRFAKVGDRVVLINITMDVGVPTILGVLRGAGYDAPALVFAASADMDPEKAVRKSLEELAHTRQLAQQLKLSIPAPRASEPYEEITDKDHHVRLYCDHENVPLAQFVFASKTEIDFGAIKSLTTGDPDSDLDILVTRIKESHHCALLADLTTEDVAQFGLKVVRAIIPGFHPLFMGHRLRALGGSRLWEVPKQLGYPTSIVGADAVPHPYP